MKEGSAPLIELTLSSVEAHSSTLYLLWFAQCLPNFSHSLRDVTCV